ncbi:hypothetical protein EON64_08525, partial [archaeon]
MNPNAYSFSLLLSNRASGQQQVAPAHQSSQSGYHNQAQLAQPQAHQHHYQYQQQYQQQYSVSNFPDGSSNMPLNPSATSFHPQTYASTGPAQPLSQQQHQQKHQPNVSSYGLSASFSDQHRRQLKRPQQQRLPSNHTAGRQPSRYGPPPPSSTPALAPVQSQPVAGTYGQQGSAQHNLYEYNNYGGSSTGYGGRPHIPPAPAAAP